MVSSLQTLTRIQKFAIDEQRKILVEYQTVEERLQKALKVLNSEFEREKAFAQQSAGITDFGAYVKRYLDNKEKLEAALADIQHKIEEVRDIISDMYKEQKTYEIVEENRKKRQEKENANKEQKMLDEVGTNTYIKNTHH